MYPAQYARAFRRWSWLILLCTALGLAAGITADGQRAARYTSTASVLVSSTSVSSINAAEAYQSALLAASRAPSYAALGTSGIVTKKVSENLDLPEADVSSALSVDVPEGTTLLDVSATTSDPRSALRLADAASERLAEVVSRLERRRSDGSALLQGDVERPAVLPVQPDEVTPPWRDPTLGAGAGLLLGLAAAVAAWRLDPRARDLDTIEAAAGAPVLAVVARGRSTSRAAVPEAGDDLRAAALALQTELAVRRSRNDRGLVATLCSPTRCALQPAVVEALAGVLVTSGARVLVLEADTCDGLEASPERTTARQLEASAAASPPRAQRHEAHGADVIVAEASSGSDLLHREEFSNLVRGFRDSYDYVLASASPESDSRLALAARSDVAICIAERGRSTRAGLRRMSADLTRVGVEIAGAVVWS